MLWTGANVLDELKAIHCGQLQVGNDGPNGRLCKNRQGFRSRARCASFHSIQTQEGHLKGGDAGLTILDDQDNSGIRHVLHDETVSNAMDGHKMPWGCRFGFQFLTQTDHVSVHSACIRERLVAPD